MPWWYDKDDYSKYSSTVGCPTPPQKIINKQNIKTEDKQNKKKKRKKGKKQIEKNAKKYRQGWESQCFYMLCWVIYIFFKAL